MITAKAHFAAAKRVDIHPAIPVESGCAPLRGER